MKKELTSLPDAEFEVMNAVWKCGGVSVPTVSVTKEMHTDKKAQTVLTMLTRLSDKGLVSSAKNGKERTWTAEISEADYRAFEAKKIVNKVYGGSFRNLFSAFYGEKGLSQAEAQELLAFIDKETEKGDAS